MKKKTIKRGQPKKSVTLNSENIYPALNQMQRLEGLPETKPSKYTASIKIFGKEYKATGGTVAEAIAGLSPVGFTKTKSILTISNGKESKDRFLPPLATYRLFSQSKLMREVAIKNISLMFGL